MSHIVKLKRYPNDNEPYFPECYINAWHESCEQTHEPNNKAILKTWKKLTGSQLKLTERLFIVTFPSEHDELVFRLKWS